MKRLFAYTLLLLLVSSCKKEELGPQYLDQGGTGGDVLLMNEGNFGWANGSLYSYSSNTGAVASHVFQNANGYALGDVVQSVSYISGSLYVVVNNSGKIEVLDPDDLTVQKTISGFNSPRYIKSVAPNKAYVTDLYQNAIYTVDLAGHNISGQISVGQWSEELTVHNGKVWVSLPDSGWVLCMDPLTDQITDTLVLTKGAGQPVPDAAGNLWVLCTGGTSEFLPALYRIDPGQSQIGLVHHFPGLTDHPIELERNGMGDSLYFINTHLYAMSIQDVILPSQALFDGTGRTFYALRMDTSKNELYVSDVKDYVQQSEIYRISSAGSLIDQFEGGIITGDFWFP